MIILTNDGSPMYLEHHGIKGQKWGVRRYQNSDGTLTDEGRRRYGYGKGASSLVTQNTKGRAKQGAKIGATIGGVLGGIHGTASAAALISAGLTPGAAIALGASHVTGSIIRTAASGAFWGTVVGAVETHKGRQYIERYDEGLKDFEMRDLKNNN